MRLNPKLFAFLIMVCSPLLQAHYFEVNSNIPDQSIVKEVPNFWQLSFSQPSRLLEVSYRDITEDYQSKWTKVRFKRSLLMNELHTVNLPTFNKGMVQLKWKALNSDGHLDEMIIEFIYR
ncbi:copper resistance protein CopC [Marinicellulosiphila megalodicopiae]|uniref:copper resistance protein CopC n=1 Tax=Marinicellulosiphila megalodicopiae TaxID=2724896 RepID=UPI003BAF4692